MHIACKRVPGFNIRNMQDGINDHELVNNGICRIKGAIATLRRFNAYFTWAPVRVTVLPLIVAGPDNTSKLTGSPDVAVAWISKGGSVVR